MKDYRYNFSDINHNYCYFSFNPLNISAVKKTPIKIKNSPTNPLVPGNPIAPNVKIINKTAYLGITDTKPP